MDFIPSPPVGRIKDVASDVFVVFNENYIRAFGVNLLKKKLDTKAVALPSPYHLLKPPKEKKFLKEGLVTKFTKRERWALNYLVLKNEADDYAFYYFATEADKDDPKKARGRIFLDSYSVREFSEKEKNEYKHQNGLVLEPWYSRRRTWIFKLETPDQTREWKDVITEAIRKSPPPFNPDPVLQKSFMSAYTKAWWHFPGYCGAYPGYGGSEQEHLAGMISDRCENEFMKETYDKIPSGFFHSTLENRVKGILDATIGASVSAGWRAGQEALDKARSPIEKVVDEKLEYVATLRREMEDKVAENIANIIGPYLQRLSGPLIQPLCKIMVEPASMALLGVIQLWNAQMKPPTVDRTQELSWNAASWYQMGPIWEGVRSFTRSDALRALDSVLKDFKKDDIESEMQNSTTTLLRKAAYTFQKESDGKTGDLAPVMSSVTQKLEHDARIIAMDTIQTVMENIISNPLKKELMPQFSKVTAPVEDMIPDAMKQIVDVDSILEKVVDKTISSTIQKVIEPLSKDRIDSIIHAQT